MTHPYACRKILAPIALSLTAMMMAGCASTAPSSTTGRYAAPIGSAPVISNETPYSRALECLAQYNAGRPAPRIAVGQIADYTGKLESDGSGRKVTQGAALMAISALSKAGAHLVERFDTSVAELELKYANNKLIGGQMPADGYRKILAGSIPGSDYYLVGGITELNFNIRSNGIDAFGAGDNTTGTSAKGNFDYKVYVMNVGLDLRLVDTKTLEVVDVISYQKQIVGREIKAGVFDILGGYIFDVGAGQSALEPIQLAVRSVIERAVVEMTSRLYGTGFSACQHSDPLGPAVPQGYYASGSYHPAQGSAPTPYQGYAPAQDYTPAPAPAYAAPAPAAYAPAPQTHTSYGSYVPSQVQPQNQQESMNAQSRQNAYSWYNAADVNSPRLRGGY